MAELIRSRKYLFFVGVCQAAGTATRPQGACRREPQGDFVAGVIPRRPSWGDIGMPLMGGSVASRPVYICWLLSLLTWWILIGPRGLLAPDQ